MRSWRRPPHPTDHRGPFARRRCRLTAAALLVVAATGFGAAGLAGCGFRPMYGGSQPAGDTTVAADLSSIRVSIIPNRIGQELRNELTLLLDPGSNVQSRRYTLNVDLDEREESLALERAGFATRANVEVTARFTLIDDAAGSPVLAGTSRAVSGYNLLNNDFSTLNAENDARSRAVDQVAYEIRNRLAAHFSKQAKAPTGDR